MESRMKINADKLTRIEVYKDDQRIVSIGDDYQFSLQDDGRTLKIFMKYNRDKRHQVLTDIRESFSKDMKKIRKNILDV